MIPRHNSITCYCVTMRSCKDIIGKIILITLSVLGLCFTQDYYKIQHQREQDVSSDFLISFFLGLKQDVSSDFLIFFFLGLKFFMASNGKIWFNLFPTRWGLVVWLANMPEYDHWQMNIIRQSLMIIHVFILPMIVSIEISQPMVTCVALH